MAMDPVTASHKTLRELEYLKAALIDTSSILYIQKAGYFGVLSRTIQLYSIAEVISELKTPVSGVTLIPNSEPLSQSTDRVLIACALKNKLAMISEDKGILLAMQRAQAPYFNALMMLNFLLLVQRIDDDGYQSYHSALKHIARYSEAVWEFGEKIYTAVKLEMDPGTLF
jgi:hypothetical protein